MSRPTRAQVLAVLPSWLVQKVPRDHMEPDEAFGRRRRVVTGVTTAGAALLCTVDSSSTYLTGVLPGFLVLGAGVGPMFVAISVAAMSDVEVHAMPFCVKTRL